MVILLPLLEGTDGVIKMSKSYPENCISINEEPKNMYGKLMSIPDNLIGRYFELLTDVPTETIETYKMEIEEAMVNPRDYKMLLARTIVTEYHSEEDAKRAEEEFITIFQRKGLPEEIEEVKVEENAPLLDLLVDLNFVASKGEAKRLIQGGGVKFDGEKITDLAQKVTFDGDEGIILQAGKRKFAKLVK